MELQKQKTRSIFARARIMFSPETTIIFFAWDIVLGLFLNNKKKIDNCQPQLLTPVQYVYMYIYITLTLDPKPWTLNQVQ